MLPRLLNLLNPSYLISRMSAPTYPSGNGKTLKITKARKRRVEDMMSLLDEAEERGCGGVWAFRGHMRMVSFGPVWSEIHGADTISSPQRASSKIYRLLSMLTKSVLSISSTRGETDMTAVARDQGGCGGAVHGWIVLRHWSGWNRRGSRQGQTISPIA
jgi:hypothetical protein